MTRQESPFALPRKIEHCLATLSKIYSQEGQRLKQEIVVNSHVRVHEGARDESWGGIEQTYGHDLYLTVPEALYVTSARQRAAIQSQLRDDINNINNIKDEYISEVFLEMEGIKDRDWRRESGVLQPSRRHTAPETAQRIWGDSGYRVFLSHKAEVKKKAAQLKDQLQPFGVSCFVAHKDIHPTKVWQDEIESALSTMDAFVALLTEDFHDSKWTDHEVGFALGRRVPIVAVKLGLDPYGFIGRFQALSCTWEDAAVELAKLMIKQARMMEAYVAALPMCKSFDQGNVLAQVLPEIETLTKAQEDKMIAAYNENAQVSGSFGFSGEKPHVFGKGLAAHLSRITGNRYTKTSSGEIRRRSK